jgi:ABC-2 type transport system permease protein
MRVRGVLNSVLKRDPKMKIRKRIGLAGYLIVPLLLFFSVHQMFKGMLLSPLAGLPVIDMLLNMSLVGLLIFLLFSGLTVSLHFFFLFKDYTLLLSAPMPHHTIFQFKYIEALIANSSVFWAFGLPLVLAYGLVAHAPFWYYPLALVSSLMFLAFPTGLAALLSISLVRIIPAKRAQNMAALIVGLIFVALWTGFQFLRVSRFDPASEHFNPNSIERLAHFDQHFPYLPSEWLARILHGAAQNDPAGLAGHFFILAATSLAIYWLGQVLMESHLRHTPTPRSAKSSIRIKTNNSSLPDSFIWALISRDIKLTSRDPRQATQMVMFAAIILVFPFITRQNMLELDGSVVTYLPFIYPLMLSSLFCGTTAARLIPLEGLSFGVIKCSPQPFYRIIIIKNLLSVFFSFVCGLLAVLITTQMYHSPGMVTLQTILTLLALNLGAAGLGSFFGTFFGKFDWEHPKRMLTGGGNLLLTLSSVGYFLIIFGLIFISIMLNLVFLCLLIVITGSLAILWLGTILAANKLESMDWHF